MFEHRQDVKSFHILVILFVKESENVTVSAIPLSDGSFTTINPSKMQDNEESKTTKSSKHSTTATPTQVTDSYGVTYVPVVTYASSRR